MVFFYREISVVPSTNIIIVNSAANVLRFSFVLQNSISYLDLPFLSDHRLRKSDIFFDSHFQYPKYLINTEEKCRTFLSRDRECLYRLNLDFPKEREYSLKYDPEIERKLVTGRYRFVSKLTVDPNFHFTKLSTLVKKAVKRSDQKLKWIKWLLMFDAVKENVFLSSVHASYFLKYIYPEVTDSAFIGAFLKRLNFRSWITHNNRPELLEFLLYHLCQNENISMHNKVSCSDLIDECLIQEQFWNIAIILKYQDAPRMPIRFCTWFYHNRHFERAGLSRDVLREAEKWMSPMRFHLLMQFLYIYFRRNQTESAAECLRLLWRSVPDAFFSLEEIEMALQAGLSSETIRDVYNFYSGVVGVFHERVQPRSLKGLCRPRVRRIFWESRCWIPDGVQQIDVPRELQSFLNLED